MTPDALTLPADVPGLDLTGLRVLDREGHGYIVVAEAGGCAYLGASGVAPAPLDRLRLSLRDPATQDRLLRWLAEGWGVRGGVGVTWAHHVGHRWTLTTAGHVFVLAPENDLGMTVTHHVPPLADVDPLAPEADLLALAAVVAWEVARG